MVKKKHNVDIDGPTLQELAGYGDAKVWGLELIEDIENFRHGLVEWSDIDHRGLLLSGPPGVGKTSFAKALAKSAGVPLIATSVAEWNAASYLSGTLQSIRDVFGRAHQAAPAILFIDEIDGISDRSTIKGDYVEYWKQIVNLVLECLAGAEERPGVVVVAATNHPDKIDPAVRRAGRLDHHIELKKPDVRNLHDIIRFHLGPDVLPSADLMSAAVAARGSTGADIESWIRRAKAKARRAGRELTLEDVLEQIFAKAAIDPQVRRRVCVHEAGHVVASHVLGVGTLNDAGIDQASGFTNLDSLIPFGAREVDIDHAIVFLLAGRAAEAAIIGDIGIGSGVAESSDLAMATGMAAALEGQCGLGAAGLVYIPENHMQDMWLRIGAGSLHR